MAHVPVLSVKGLKTWFHTRDGIAKSVDGVDLQVQPGEVLGIVGESGCGKSVTALSIMRLIPPPGRIESGKIEFNDKDLLSLSPNEMAKLRGEHISMIFQDPSSSLNPVVAAGQFMRVGARPFSWIGNAHLLQHLDSFFLMGVGDRLTVNFIHVLTMPARGNNPA